MSGIFGILYSVVKACVVYLPVNQVEQGLLLMCARDGVHNECDSFFFHAVQRFVLFTMASLYKHYLSSGPGCGTLCVLVCISAYKIIENLPNLLISAAKMQSKVAFAPVFNLPYLASSVLLFPWFTKLHIINISAKPKFFYTKKHPKGCFY